jgi:hypothetical protein
VSRNRALLAAALATVYPGLGHVYLRSWFRALTWFGLWMVTAAVVVPPSVFSAYQTGGLDAILEASRNVPTDALLALLAVRALNVVDAAWLGMRPRAATGRSPGQGHTCPNCGRDLDDDLDFCHWCTAQLEGRAEESRSDGGLL